MNFINQLFSDSFFNAIGWTIFHSFWQGALITIVVGTVLLIFSSRSSRFRFNLSFIGLILIFTIVMITFFQVYQTNENIYLNALVIQTSISADQVTEVYDSAQQVNSEKFIAAIKMFFSNNLSYIVTFWFVGMLIFSLKFLGGILYIEKIKTTQTIPLPEKWKSKIDELFLKVKLKKPVKIIQSAILNTPITIGYIKPVVLLPIGLISGFPSNQIEAIILHEFAHIKRNDFLLNVIQTIVETVLFYHPGVWLLSSIIRSERENCCDDFVIESTGDSLSYSKALYNLQNHIKLNSKLVLAANGNENQLYRRINRMSGQTKNKLSLGIKFVALLLVLTLIAAASFYAPKSYAFNPSEISKAGIYKPNLVSSVGLKFSDKINFSQIDTIKLKKGKRTLRFTEEESGEKVHYKAKLNNGKIESLYKDGEKIAAEEHSKYEDKVLKKVDEYNSLLREREELRKEHKEKMKELTDKMREHNKKLRKFSQRYHSDFDFDFEFTPPDLSGLKESLKELKENMHKDFAEGSIHIPPIPSIPPIPPIHIDEDEMKEWKKEFKESMKDFKIEMEKFKVDMKKQNWNMDEFKENMKVFGEDMKKFGAEMKKFGEFVKEMKSALIADGIIDDEDEIDDLLLSEKKMEVNGKSIPENLHKKYLDMYEKYTSKKLTGDKKIKIND